MSDAIALALIVGGMALSWLYALGIDRFLGDRGLGDRGLGDRPGAKP